MTYNQEKRRASARAWYWRHHDKAIASRRQYYLRNKEQELEALRQAVVKKRAALFELLGGAKCARCGFSDTRALQFDHINAGGRKDRERVGVCQMMYVYYVS